MRETKSLALFFLILSISMIPFASSQVETTVSCNIWARGPQTDVSVASDSKTVNVCTGDCRNDVVATCSYGGCTYEGLYEFCASCSSTEGCGTIGDGERCSTYKTVSWDESQTDCGCETGSTSNWLVASSFETGTLSRCCGDDTGENYRSRSAIANSDATSGFTTSTTDNACCNAATDCVESHACTTSGAMKGTIPSKNYCYDKNWYGGDYSDAYCTAIIGSSGNWNIGGEVATTVCCGDDSSEFKRTTQELVSGEGAVIQSTDDTACCNAAADCVYDNACYSVNSYKGEYLCSNGVWHDGNAPTASLDPPYQSTWTNQPVTASVQCADNDASPSSGPDQGSRAIYVSSAPITTCPTAGYGGVSSQISQHSWACSYCQDNADNADYSDSPAEFRVDTIQPTITHDYNPPGPCYDSPVTIHFTFDDTGDSGIKEARWCEDSCDVDQGAIIPCVPGSHCEWDKIYDQNGIGTITVKVWDNAGNSRELWFVWCVFKTGPTTWVDAEPPDVKTSWINADAQATARCDPEEGGECPGGATCGCEDTLQIVTIPYNPQAPPMQSCSEIYVDYDDAEVGDETIDVTEHSWVCARSKSVTEQFGYSSPTRFYIDKDNATSWINDLPEWTNERLGFQVGWDGDDDEPLGSGIRNYTVDFVVRDNAGQTVVGWTRWLTETTMADDVFYANERHDTVSSELINGATYCFRVYSSDNAGNVEPEHSGQLAGHIECIRVDRSIPTCDFVLPDKDYANIADLEANGDRLLISWEGDDDGGEENIDYYTIMYKTNSTHADTMEMGCDMDWTPLMEQTLEKTAEKSNPSDDCTYYFQCEVADKAGNIGYSEIVNTTIDRNLPDAGMVKPSVEWATSSFNLSWAGRDRTSGIGCYYVQWSPDGLNWNYLSKNSVHLTECTTDAYITFDGTLDAVGALGDGSVFWFRMSATDGAGNPGGWNSTWSPGGQPFRVTIDKKVPAVEYVITDQDGNPIIGKVVSSKDVSKISVKSSATDELSGVQSNMISYDMLIGNIRIIDSTDCGSAPPYGGVSQCTKDLDYAEDVVLKFRIIVTDRAGNINMTDVFFIVTHPLANFIGTELVLTLGDAYISQLQVRNLQEQADTVTVWLYGYPLANFIDLTGGEVTEKGRVLSVNLNPDEERTYHIRILSSEPETEYLYLNASSSLVPQSQLNDTDTLTIMTSFPASFPALDELSSLVLMGMSLPIYALLKRKKLV